SPVRQKKRGQAPERAKAIQAEVQKLVEVGIMREVYYHDWLSNLVMNRMKRRRPSTPGKGCTATRKCLLVSECWRYIPAADGQSFRKPNRSEHRKAEQAFKQHLSELPLLVAPKPKEELIIYLSATYGAISAVLMTERGTIQTLIYFISRALQGPKLNYSPMEKLVLSLVFAAKRLRRYFQAHPITVITDQPIKQVMSRPDVAGRLQKWSIMLGEHNIVYMSRTLVKGQILADFLIEMPGENPQAAPTTETQEEPWTLFTDGSSCVDGFGAGLILTNPEGVEFTYALRFQFAVSNNEAEYEALIDGLRIAARMGVKDVHLRVLVQTGTRRSTQRQIHKRKGGGNSNRGRRTDLDDTDSGSFKRRNSPRRQEGVKKAPPQGPTIRINRGNSLQAVVPYAVVKMRWTALGGIVVMDYFTMWIKAKVVATITGGQVKKFVWDNVVCRFGIPGEIVSDNGKQFSDNPFKDWCDKLNITQRFASVKHPQSNGLVERANRSLGKGIKSRMGERNKNWVEELPHVLWAHRTMIKSSHGDTPFFLTYGTEAVIPTEIKMPTYRTAAVDVVSNDEELRLNLDLLEERRERAAIYEANAKSKMMNITMLGFATLLLSQVILFTAVLTLVTQ
nr:reverse transcriptase domain-containing protein [Tanacetum cinerariifolium]